MQLVIVIRNEFTVWQTINQVRVSSQHEIVVNVGE